MNEGSNGKDGQPSDVIAEFKDFLGGRFMDYEAASVDGSIRATSR